MDRLWIVIGQLYFENMMLKSDKAATEQKIKDYEADYKAKTEVVDESVN